MQADRTIVVVGAGIAGLALTHNLRRIAAEQNAPVRVICLEASARAGGNIRTSQDSGYLCEWGPNGFLDSEPATLALVGELGLESRLVQARSSAARRFVMRGGRLHEVPTGAGAFLGTGLLGLTAKLRLLGEPFIPRRRATDDESVHSFASRRIGADAADVLVDAMVAGVYAGDSRQLSLEATFPKMLNMERDHGGLFRAMIARRRDRSSGGGPAGPAGVLTSFDGGMQTLIDGLTDSCGDSLKLETAATRVERIDTGGYRVLLRDAPPVEAETVVLACPAWFASELLCDLDEELAGDVGGIASAPVVVAHLGFAREGLGHDLNGFGFLVPSSEDAQILGALWSSSIFPARSANDRALLTCMIGGARNPQAADLDDARLLQLVLKDLHKTMGIAATPEFTRVLRHPRGIPQYTLGHPERLARIDTRVATHTGLVLSGNSYRGVAINACVAEASRLAAPTLAKCLAGAGDTVRS